MSDNRWRHGLDRIEDHGGGRAGGYLSGDAM
jgi:hypothetical protein